MNMYIYLYLNLFHLNLKVVMIIMTGLLSFYCTNLSSYMLQVVYRARQLYIYSSFPLPCSIILQCSAQFFGSSFPTFWCVHSDLQCKQLQVL